MGSFKPSNTVVPEVLDIHDTTTSSANAGAQLKLSVNDGAPMGDSHRLGVIEFTGAEDSDGTQIIGARIEAMTEAAWTNVENGSALYFYTTDGNASQSLVFKLNSDKRATFEGNVGVGTQTFDGSAAGVIAIKNGTSPAALTADQIYIGSKNSAGSGTDTLATLELFTEEAVDSTALNAVGTLSKRLPVWVNGTCYWLYLDPV